MIVIGEAMKDINIVVAIDQNNGIGKDGQLPWHLSADLKHFKKITTSHEKEGCQNVVLMGRKTWESIPAEFRPLKGRVNIVLSSKLSTQLPDGVLKADSFEKAFLLMEEDERISADSKVFVIGGQKMFEAALSLPNCTQVFVTHILKEFPCDVFFPAFFSEFEEILRSATEEDSGLSFYFALYKRIGESTS